MKINKAKLLVGTLAIAAVAATVGSISGTVAWFQYSTRVTAAYHGAAAHCTENLEIRIRSSDNEIGKWQHDLTTAQIAAYLEAAAGAGGAGRTVATNTLRPVTSGELAADSVASTLYKNPIYQYPTMSDWGTASATEDYILLPLELRVADVDGDNTADYLEKKIWVSDVTIQAQATKSPYDASAHTDLSSAIRVGVSAGQNEAAKTAYTTFSSNGSEVVVAGALDLNGDTVDDKKPGYDFESAKDTIQYGYESGEADSHKALSTSAAAKATTGKKGVADDSNPHTIVATEIGSTTATKNLEVDVLIYLEGWTQISDSAIWDITKADGAQFNVGIRFSAETHNKVSE
ncbi:MAG: hypothetical protein IJ787_05095 [Bacilli bacterium]|nr:hypothetical protein [Bacilli bacterium]